MKFLCTKVKDFWLTSGHNRQKVTNCGLIIKEPFVGIELKGNEPTEEEYKIMNSAIEELFEAHKKAFTIRLIDL